MRTGLRMAGTALLGAFALAAATGGAFADVTVLGWPGGPEEAALRKAAEAYNAKADTAVAQLPVDTKNAQIDARNLTEDDIKRLRNARVVDLRTIDGRPLTDEESRQLTARFKAAKLAPGARPLYLPPEEYFTTVKGQDLVCLAPNGELVPLSDKSCPPEIRKALAAQAN